MVFSDNLRKAREKKNLSQEQLADLLNLPKEEIVEWEGDGVYPEMDQLIEITKVLDTSLDFLLLDKDTSDSHNEKEKEEDKWEFEDYAFTITGVLVGFLLVVPELLYALFEISILGGSLGDTLPGLVEELEDGSRRNMWDIAHFRSLSPLLFMLTTTIVFFKDAYDARKTGGYAGSVFNHTFESLLEDAIYMAITTIMLYGAVLFGTMYISWLAGPITWVLFIFLFPIAKGKSNEYEKVKTPWFLLFILAGGIIAELISGGWIAFPLSWLMICLIKFIDTIRYFKSTVDDAFDVMYYGFSVVLMAVGVFLNHWIASWVAFPVALFICWILSKFSKFKGEKVKTK